MERNHFGPIGEQVLVTAGEDGTLDQPCARTVSPDDAQAACLQSAENSVEEGLGLLVGEILDDVLAVGRMPLRASEHLVDRKLEILGMGVPGLWSCHRTVSVRVGTLRGAGGCRR